VGKLVLYLADGSTLDVLLNRERVTIGRRADNDVCLPYPAVSAEHASVVTILSDSFLEDRGSTNGTLVNGRPVVKHFLRDRDQIDIGRQKLVFVSDESLHLEPAYANPVGAHKSVLGERVDHVPPPRPDDLRPDAEPESGQKIGAASGRESNAMGEIDRFVSAEVAADARAIAENAAPARGDIVAEFLAEDDLARAPSVRVLSGVNAGRTIALMKDGMSLGRAGVQVAVVRRSPHGARLVPLEGERAPIVNGAEVPAEGTELRNGDVVEIAGVKLEFMSARARS
jgi:pSer/pThr/pTyr-binding forkhead associated (FHA) protein